MPSTTFPQWTLDPEQIELARMMGFHYREINDRFRLYRESDHAIIWPHVDAFISAFVRQGYYVKRKRMYTFEDVLNRSFGDPE